MSGLERIAFTLPSGSRGRRNRDRARPELVRLATGDRPTADAARAVLQGRAEAVEYLLPVGQNRSSPLHGPARHLLITLPSDTPVEIRELLCGRAPYEPLAREVVLDRGWLPGDERRHHWFLVIIGAWLQYAGLDPEGLELRPTCRLASDGDWWLMVEARHRFERGWFGAMPDRARPLLLIFDEMIAERERIERRARDRASRAAARGASPPPASPPTRGRSGTRRSGGNWADRAEDAMDAVDAVTQEAEDGDSRDSGGSDY